MPLVSDVQNLQQRTKGEFETIRTTPGIFQRFGQSLFIRSTSLIEARGGHCEHFIWVSGDRNSEIFLSHIVL